MALVRVRRAAQLTLPAELRQALDVKEGDYLEAEVVAGGVLLKPVSVVTRRHLAWEKIKRAASKVRDLKPDPNETMLEKEQAIAEEVMKMRRERRRRRKHA